MKLTLLEVLRHSLLVVSGAGDESRLGTRSGMSLERAASPVLIGDLFNREDAPVRSAHEEPRELTESRIVERLRRPNGLA